MINFSDLESVEKTYTKTGGGRPAEEWSGIKLRVYQSEAGRKKVEESGKEFSPFRALQYEISDKLMEQLDLENHGLHQFKLGDGTPVIAVMDEEKSSFFKGRKRKEGEDKNPKATKFSNPILEKNQIEAGLIPNVEEGIFYFDLEKIAVEGTPDYVKGIYKFIPQEEGTKEVVTGNSSLGNENSSLGTESVTAFPEGVDITPKVKTQEEITEELDLDDDSLFS